MLQSLLYWSLFCFVPLFHLLTVHIFLTLHQHPKHPQALQDYIRASTCWTSKLLLESTSYMESLQRTREMNKEIPLGKKGSQCEKTSPSKSQLCNILILTCRSIHILLSGWVHEHMGVTCALASKRFALLEEKRLDTLRRRSAFGSTPTSYKT